MLLDKTIPFSYIFKKVKTQLFYVLLIGILISYITLKFKYLIPDIPVAIPSFLGTAISVILSFKLNQSYDRWWEARKVWGSIVNDSRNLILQLQSFIKIGNEKNIKIIAYRQIGWCYCLGQTLRGLAPLKDMEKYLLEEDMKKLTTHNNKPLGILQLNGEDLQKLRETQQIELFSAIHINNTLVNLINYMGMAERIKSTVFPATYRLFLHSLIYLFTITLSISLKNMAYYFEIPLLMIISTFFFLLERTATHLQDPFSDKPTDTAMTAIATNIEINIKQLLKEKEVTVPLTTDDFYIK